MDDALRLQNIIDHFIRYMHRGQDGQDWLDRAGGTNMTLPQFKFLMILSQIGPSSLKRVAGEIGVSAGSASSMADKLVELGFVERQPDPEDRRAVVLNLTDQARAFLEEKSVHFVKRITYLMDRLGEEDTAKWVRIMEKIDSILVETFEEERNEVQAR